MTKKKLFKPVLFLTLFVSFASVVCLASVNLCHPLIPGPQVTHTQNKVDSTEEFYAIDNTVNSNAVKDETNNCVYNSEEGKIYIEFPLYFSKAIETDLYVNLSESDRCVRLFTSQFDLYINGVKQDSAATIHTGTSELYFSSINLGKYSFKQGMNTVRFESDASTYETILYAFRSIQFVQTEAQIELCYLYQDFSNDLGTFAGNVTVENGLATFSTNSGFDVPMILNDKNDYQIDFDINLLSNVGRNRLFLHLPGLNPLGENIYLEIQEDGFVCLNVWKEGVWHYIYGFQQNLGGFRDGPVVTWFDRNSGTHHFTILIVDGFIQVNINGYTYIAQHMSNFGAYSNDPSRDGSVNLMPSGVDGKLERLFFHPEGGSNIQIDNVVIKGIPTARKTFTVTDKKYTIDYGYSVADLLSHDYKVEATYNVHDANMMGNLQLILKGINGTVGYRDGGTKSLNVQLNFDHGNGTAYPCFFWNNDLWTSTANWLAKVGDLWSIGDATQVKIGFSSIGDVVTMMVNDAVMFSDTYQNIGLPRGAVYGFGIEDNPSITFDHLTYTSLS